MRVLLVLSIAANAAAALQLYRLALHRRYPGFLAFLVFNAARTLFLVSLGNRSSTDEALHLLAMPVLWILNVVVVLEIYRSVLGDFRGIYSTGVWALRIATLLSALVSVIVFPRESEASGLSFWITTLDHSVRWGLLTLMLLLVMFYSRYPIKLRRNLMVHGITYGVYFLTDTLSSAAGQVNNAALILSTACYVTWAAGLTRAGEERRVDLHRSRDGSR